MSFRKKVEKHALVIVAIKDELYSNIFLYSYRTTSTG